MLTRALLWLVLFLSLASAGAVELRFDGTETKEPLITAAEFFEDPQGSMSVEEVVHLDSFSPRVGSPDRGRAPMPVWLRLRIVNTSAQPLLRWLEIQPGRFRQTALYIQQDGHWQHLDAGADQPFNNYPVPTAKAVFPLTLPPNEVQTFYLRITRPGAREILPILWEPTTFLFAENQARLVHGFIFGGLLVTASFGLLLLFLLKDRAFAFSALATLTYCLGEASSKGYGTMYLWPDATAWSLRSLPIFALLGVGFNILFLRELLATRVHFPRIERLLLVLLALQWLPAIGILFGNFWVWSKLSFTLHFPVTASLVLVGIYAMIKGVHAARYYSAAYAVLAIGSLMQVLNMAGHLPLQESFASNILPVSMLLSNILILASVVDRIIAAQREKWAAQDALLALRSAHADQLEQAVAERTADLHSALAETRAANRVKSRLIAFVGHDLRTPLATVINYARLLGHQPDPNARRYQATIERSALHQLKLIDELVEYARGELDHLELLPAPTYLYDWLQQLTDEAELLAKQRGNRFLLKADSSLPPVLVFDPMRLRQVMLNLLGNAAKFTHDGEIRFLLHTESRTEEEITLFFAVEDTGQGISQDDIERVLQPFERGTSDQDGFGLGLAIARQLVQAMDDELRAESAPGQGCCFHFRLRLRVGKEADVVLAGETLAVPEAIGAGRRVLVVDDNRESLECLREILMAADFDVVCEQHAPTARDLAMAGDFDLLLLDQMMPVVNGWEFLRRLHEPGIQPPPVILCSAMPAQRPDGYPEKIGFAAHLLKPIIAPKLLQTIRELFCEECPNTLDRPSAAMLENLRRMIDGGCLSEIEDWAAALHVSHPEFSAFADRVRGAALRIDFVELTALSETI